MSDNWDTEIGGLLAELADVQSALLETLHEKRQILATNDHVALASMAAREETRIARLQACQDRRQQLLSRASVLIGSDNKIAGAISHTTVRAVFRIRPLRPFRVLQSEAPLRAHRRTGARSTAAGLEKTIA